MWTRLTNTAEGHFKFYSVEWKRVDGKKKLTGKVQFGRIGKTANEYQYAPVTAKKKYVQKIAKGYEKLNDATSGVVFSEEVRIAEWC